MMKKHLTNIYAGLLILAIIAVVLIRIWAADREASYIGPTAIKTDINGTTYLVSANVLYIHDKDGDLVERIPLEKFGIDQFIGDFWIFRNGDILLRRGVQQKPTLSREIQMFLRIGSGKQDNADQTEGILQRCSLATFRCEQFGSGIEAFKKMTTFKLAVDEEKESVYIADTLEHRLLLYDLQGTLRRKSDLSFKFPNGVLLAKDGLLYVADTNNHRIAGVSTAFESFGRVDKEFRVSHNQAKDGAVWPSALLLIDDNQWWVINAGNDMRNGDVVVYDRGGRFIRQIDLPGDADPLALAAWGNRVLITDPSRMRVYRINQNGTREEDFGSLLLTIEFHEIERERNLYAFFKNVSLATLVGLLVLTFVVAKKTRKQEKGPEVVLEKRQGVQVNASLQSQARRYDFHNQRETIKYAGAAVLLSLIIALIILPSVGGGIAEHGSFFRALQKALLVTVAGFLGGYVSLKNTYYEVSDSGILAVKGKKKIFSPWHQVRQVKAYQIGKYFRTCILKTDAGTIKIGNVEPADTPLLTWRDMLKKRAVSGHWTALIEEIKNRTPQAKKIFPWSASQTR